MEFHSSFSRGGRGCAGAVGACGSFDGAGLSGVLVGALVLVLVFQNAIASLSRRAVRTSP
jgi:hypothetical protein